MDIRKYIKNNFIDCDNEDIKETILASVNSKDEVVLPGLGVLFEILWNNSDDNTKELIINNIFQSIKKT